MAVDLDESRIDVNDPRYHAMLGNIQANIIKGHGREEADHIFLEFTASPPLVKKWIEDFSRAHVTSARQQIDDAAAFRNNGVAGGLLACFFLSAEGYRVLGLDPGRFQGAGTAFGRGMKDRRSAVVTPNRDPKPAVWDKAYRGSIHAMILLADDSADTLAAGTHDVSLSVAAVAKVVAVEHGNVLRNDDLQGNGKGKPIEHFGYVDGRSNPLFLSDEIDREIEQKGGTDNWDPSAPLKQVLVDDPFTGEEDTFGSFLVFRKLEQDVQGFQAAVDAVASKLGIDHELAGALAVGRFRDGTPVTLRPTAGAGDINNFEYQHEDRWASRCPFHAHIRKVNPRGGTPLTSAQSERSRRIVRRGVPYGRAISRSQAGLASEHPRGRVGLLFMCYQADIDHQFEFITRVWADNANFPEFLLIPGLNTGDDPVIGQDHNASQKWRAKWGRLWSRPRKFNFGGSVTLRGGEYFFAPSLNFLNTLSTV